VLQPAAVVAVTVAVVYRVEHFMKHTLQCSVTTDNGSAAQRTTQLCIAVRGLLSSSSYSDVNIVMIVVATSGP
jgi:hypothetical protein